MLPTQCQRVVRKKNRKEKRHPPLERLSVGPDCVDRFFVFRPFGTVLSLVSRTVEPLDSWLRRWFEVEDRVLYCYNAQGQSKEGCRVKRAAILYQASVVVCALRGVGCSLH